MSNEPPLPFDIVKATFYLVAGVFAVYSLVIFLSLAICALYTPQGTQATWTSCGREGGILEALTTLLASALAFAAGRTSSK